MANTRRIPFVLNLNDPVDEAIWEALQPLLTRRRGSQFIRGAVAQALGIGGLLPSVAGAGLQAGHESLALSSGETPRAVRPRRRTEPEPEAASQERDDGALDAATDNFLNMFG